MTKYGSQFSATDQLKKANGTSHNSPAKIFKNKFALETDGGTAEPLVIAKVGPGHVFDELKIETDANLAAINFTVGTAAAPAKYKAAIAGPNATTLVLQPLLALTLEASTEAEEIILTPSAALPGAGTIRTTLTTVAR